MIATSNLAGPTNTSTHNATCKKADASDTPDSASTALAKVDITGVKIDLRGIQEFGSVLNNTIKAISRGIGAWYGWFQ
jgi:hypothetical protein